MTRVGLSLAPEEFAAAVSECFRLAEPISEEVVQERFRKGRPYRDFRTMLRRAQLPPDARILAVGCGRGLAGRSAAYAAGVTREVYPLATIHQVNYSPGGEEAAAPPYDMVVTHSLVHFLLEPGPLCRFVCAATAEHGCYLMANEPNARFWRNGECVAAMEQASLFESRRREFRKYADPARYFARLLRVVRPGETADLAAGVNRLLRQRLAMTGELTTKEIVRIVDPHVRDIVPGTYRLGSDGLDWDDLAAGPMPGWKPAAVMTSGYVMRDNPARVPERWREFDQELAERHPHDGRSFTALWRRGNC